MNNSDLFILTTDFSTLGNDGTGEIIITVPASITIQPNTVYNNSVNFSVGTPGAPARVSIETSVSPGEHFVGSSVQYTLSGSTQFGQTAYTTMVYVTRPNSNQVQVRVLIIGDSSGGGARITTNPSAQTIRVKVNTFVPPFS